jgi:hypothetical protein
VAVQPDIICRIVKDNNQIAEFIYNKAIIKPQTQEDIQVEWPTTLDTLKGDYTGTAIVSLQGQTLSTENLSFKILPPGTLTKQGIMTSLNYQGSPSKDTVLKVVAGFKNTGEGDARAKLVAEVYYNGNLIDQISSEEALVGFGEVGTCTAYYKPDQDGKYTFKGYINYEGKQTAWQELVINVGASAEPQSGLQTADVPSGETADLSGKSPSIPYPIIIVVVLLIAAGAIIIIRERKRRETQ